MTRVTVWKAILVSASLVVTIPTAAWGKDNLNKNQWRVQHRLTNQRHEQGTPLLLRVEDHSIQALDGKALVLNVPAERVLAITYDDDVHRPVGEWITSTAGVVTRDVVRQTLAAEARNDWLGIGRLSGMVCAGSGAMFCRYKDENFMATLVGDVEMAAFAAIFDRAQKFHCIDLVWMEDGVVHNALFHVNDKKDERPLLDALSAEAGKPWVDLTEKRRQLREEIDKYKPLAQVIVIDRPVLLDGQNLAAGEYRMVPVEREKDVQLIFFRGKSVAAEGFVAQATAQRRSREEASADESSAPASVRYAAGEAGIAEITTSDATFSLGAAAEGRPMPGAVAESTAPEAAAATAAAPAMPAAPATTPATPVMPTAPTATPATSSTIVPPGPGPATTPSSVTPDLPVLRLALKENTAEITLVTYRGQRAFRFPVEHTHAHYGLFAKQPLEECAGSLYVMADRIAFDAGLNMHKDRDPFDVARSEVKEARIIGRSATSWGTIRIVVGKNKYDFMPYFSNTTSPLAHPPGRGPAGGIGWVTGFKQLWNTGTAGRPMLDAFMDALEDFSGTAAEVESGHYTPKPHKGKPQKNEEEEQSSESSPTP